ncbi:MAG TPA: hypothetical protein PL160_02115 [Candidatus Cloacimonas sp.]|nr:hypothetical protein [Candidatus Cloacimonas sp.]
MKRLLVMLLVLLGLIPLWLNSEEIIPLTETQPDYETLRKHVLYRFIEGAAASHEAVAGMTLVKKLLSKTPEAMYMDDFQVICERIPWDQIRGSYGEISQTILNDEYLQDYYKAIITKYDPILSDEQQSQFRSEYYNFRRALSSITVRDPRTSVSFSMNSYSITQSQFSEFSIPIYHRMAEGILRLDNNYGIEKQKRMKLSNSEFDILSTGFYLAINPMFSESESKQLLNAGLGFSSFWNKSGLRMGMNLDFVKWYGIKYNNFYLFPAGLTMLVPIGNQAFSVNGDFYYTGFRQKSKLNRLPRYLDCYFRYNPNWRGMSFLEGKIINTFSVFGDPEFGTYSTDSPFFLKVGIQFPFNDSVDRKVDKNINTETIYVNLGASFPGTFGN